MKARSDVGQRGQTETDRHITDHPVNMTKQRKLNQ